MRATFLTMAAGLSLCLFFSSCSNDEVIPKKPTQPPVSTAPGGNSENPQPPVQSPTPTPPAGTGNRLTLMGTKSLTWDAQGRLTKMEYTNELYGGYSVVYEGEKPVRLNFQIGGYLLYTYSGDKVTEAKRYYGENLVNYHYKFGYEGDKLVRMDQISYARSDEGQLTVNRYRYDQNGNLTQIEVASSTGTDESTLSAPSYISYGDYDNRENPQPFAESYIYLPGIKLFRNNPGFRESSGYRELYTYAYQENGLPKERAGKLNTHPHVPAVVTSYRYQ